jgi:multidrug efflux pump subunit AcrA (membrane-fusion protein)
MQHRKRIIIPIVILIAVAALTIWYLVGGGRAAGNGALDASGTVEAVEVAIAPELSGRVAEVLVEQGDRVATGDLVLRLDDSLLQAQRQRSVTALEAAKKNLVVAQAGLKLAGLRTQPRSAGMPPGQRPGRAGGAQRALMSCTKTMMWLGGSTAGGGVAERGARCTVSLG